MVLDSGGVLLREKNYDQIQIVHIHVMLVGKSLRNVVLVDGSA